MMLVVILLGALLPVATLGQMPGGIQVVELPLTHPAVVFAAEETQKGLFEDFGQSVDLEEVVLARSQVTNMVNYYLTLRFSMNYVCDVNVTDNWQTGRLELLGGPACRQPRGRRSARQIPPGGISDPVPLSSVVGTYEENDVLGSLDVAVCTASKQNSKGKAFKIVRTSGVDYTSQVTAGMTYRFYDVPIVLTTCSDSVCDRDALANCDQHPQGQVQLCDFRVQHSPWMPPGKKHLVSLDDSRDLPACLELLE